MKILEVVLPGPGGMTWTENVDAIIKNRVDHFAAITNMALHSDEYRRLVEVSSRDSEVIDWARRLMSPPQLRGRSWYACRVAFKVVEGVAPIGIVLNPADAALAELQAENAKLRAELAKVVKEPVPA